MEGGVKVKHICPICKYDGLFEEPYDDGVGSDEICPCCGFQFGCDDFPEKELQIQSWREKWIATGCKWFSHTRKPPLNWNPQKQLLRQ